MGIWTFLNPLTWFRRKQNGLRVKLRAELYDGDLHPVVDVEGIGPEFGRRLAEVGLLNTDQLLAHPAAAVAAAVGTQEARVRTWQAMAELAVVNGIGPQYAEALARGGVEGIRDLVSRDATTITDEVNAYLSSLNSTVTGGKVSQKRVETWQATARGMTRRKVTVRLFGNTLPPVSKQARRDAAANGRTTPAPPTTVRNGAPRSTATTTTARSTAETTKAPRRTPAKTASTAKTCVAVTAAGSPCKRAARDGSKYCASHKGYRAPAKATTTRKAAPKTASKSTAKTATKTTSRSAARKTTAKPATKATGNGKTGAANGAAKATTRRVHVTHNGYRLYQKGNRFYFSKKTQAQLKQDGAEPVYELPRDREVKVTQNGLPVLKSK